MSASLAVAGWIAAAGALAVALATRRELGARMERLARAAHELRRPLTAARLAADGLARADGDRPARAASIERELARAARLLRDLDAVRGAEAPGSACLVVVPELLAAVASSAAGVAEAAGRSVVVEPWDEVLVVRGHADRLEQALGNLLANALEHGEGSVRVSARGRDGRVEIEVVDAGNGLPAPADELARRARAGRGARGRGLAIVQEIATAHGGALHTRPGAACVVLELPAAPGTTAATRLPAAA